MNNTAIEVLLVEDSIPDAELTIRALNKHKLAGRIVHVKDGAEALEFLYGKGQYEGRNISNKPKVILLDLKMPKVNGLEVLEKITSSEVTKTIPVVVLTSSKEHPDVAKSYSLGANSYIVKPVDAEGFRRVVSELGAYWLHYNQPPV